MFWILFLIFLAACAAPVASGGLFAPGDWYRDLSKPSWTPPDWMFPVAWTILYIAMSVAAARIALLPDTGLALGLWSVQITLNTLWSPVFFGLRQIFHAGIIVIALWLAVATTMVAFWLLDPVAGALMAPYLLWVTIAAALNWRVWSLNREA
ncbi:MAG: tryptophan-rich sensory protein [Hyphomonadaceae bacterium]|nr:tryptophan-rich sensory protein [Hyphomonadaceae bacterium]